MLAVDPLAWPEAIVMTAVVVATAAIVMFIVYRITK